jgi:hypothetical protein
MSEPRSFTTSADDRSFAILDVGSQRAGAARAAQSGDADGAAKTRAGNVESIGSWRRAGQFTRSTKTEDSAGP